MLNEQQSSTTAPTDGDLRAQIQAAAEAADAGEGPNPLDALPSAQQGNEAQSQETDNRASESGAEENPGNPESTAEKTEKTEAQKSQQQRDEKGKFKTGEQQKPNEQQPNETKYQKAKKDADRLDKTWKNVNDRKAELERREQELARREQAATQQPNQPAKQPRFGSSQYEQAAQDFEKQAVKLMENADIDGAKENLDLAKQARVAAGQAAQAEAQENAEKTQVEWRETAEKLIKEVPELGDPESELSQAVVEVLEANPILGHVPNGFRIAYDAVNLKREAAAASGLRDELAKATKEIERLNGLLSPQGGKGTAGHAQQTPFEQLPHEEQRKQLMRMAEEADGA